MCTPGTNDERAGVQMSLLITSWVLLAGACPTLSPQTPVVLAVSSADPELRAQQPSVQRKLRNLLDQRVKLVALDDTLRALSAEGGVQAREARVLEARVRLEQAEARFKELDDVAALTAVAEITTRLVSVHQDPEAIRLLARAHLLAAAIYLARDAREAVQARLYRALDLQPNLQVPRDRFDPRLIAELAAAEQSRGLRPTGRLEVRVSKPWLGTMVYVDGQPQGPAPLRLDALPAGPHLLRVSADGAHSELASLRIIAGETVHREVHLRVDPERQAMDRLAQGLRAEDQAPKARLSQLARRAQADHAIVAELLLAPQLSATGSATVAVRLWSSTGGTGWAPDASLASLSAAISGALGCEPTPWPARLAPPLLGLDAPLAGAVPVPAPQAWWQAPWVWAVTAGVVLGAAGALVAARASSGPPESLSITLVPRP